MLCLSGFKLYSRWVPSERVVIFNMHFVEAFCFVQLCNPLFA